MNAKEISKVAGVAAGLAYDKLQPEIDRLQAELVEVTEKWKFYVDVSDKQLGMLADQKKEVEKYKTLLKNALEDYEGDGWIDVNAITEAVGKGE